MGPDAFDGPQPDDGRNARVFGGQVAAQALLAAGLTAPDRPPHSLHLYFLRAGDPRAPLWYNVTRLRDGGTFSARAVTVTQGDDRVILEALASFTEPVDVVDYQGQMPDVPAPESLLPMEVQLADYADRHDGFWVQPRAVSMRYVDPPPLLAADLPHPPGPVTRLWLRVDGDVPNDAPAAGGAQHRVPRSRDVVSPAAGFLGLASLSPTFAERHRSPRSVQRRDLQPVWTAGVHRGARGLSRSSLVRRTVWA